MKNITEAPPEFWIILGLAVGVIAWTVYLQIKWTRRK